MNRSNQPRRAIMADKLTVLFLNAWGMRYSKQVFALLDRPYNPFDVMCFTEVSHLRSPLKQAKVYQKGAPAPALLDGHRALTERLNLLYEHRFDSSDTREWICDKTQETFTEVAYGSSLFWRRRGEFKQLESGVIPINTGLPVGGVRTLQWILVIKNGVRYLIAHLHGVWIEGNTKGDSPERLLQSKLVRTKLEELMSKKGVRKLVFGGDLNLDIDTEAIRKLEGTDTKWRLLNLICMFNKQGTRTPLYRKHGEGSQHADYVLTSPAVNVDSLTVDTGFLGSDHAPLVVTFS